jgi:hypothetical protein
VEEIMELEQEFDGYATFVRLTEGVDMTPADITAAINAIKFVGSAFDEVADVKDKTKFASLLRAIAGADLAAAKLESEMAEKIREINRLMARVETLEAEKLSSSQKPARSLIFKDGLYYEEGTEDGPFCPSCYDDKEKIIRLTEEAAMFQVFGKFKCRTCNSYYA